MANKSNVSAKLTKDQKEQHRHVLDIARQNLDTVINQVESLDHENYDSVLEDLDNAKTSLAQAGKAV